VIIPFWRQKAPRLLGACGVIVRLVPVAIEIWSVDERLRKVGDITLYNDGVPESPGAWSDFRTTVFISDCKDMAALSSFPLRHRSKLKEWRHRHVSRKSRCADCKFAASPLAVNHTIAWRWVGPRRKRFRIGG